MAAHRARGSREACISLATAGSDGITSRTVLGVVKPVLVSQGQDSLRHATTRAHCRRRRLYMAHMAPAYTGTFEKPFEVIVDVIRQAAETLARPRGPW